MSKVRIVPLGGMNEVGERNCYAIIYGKDAILLDCGQKVPLGMIERKDMGSEYFPNFRVLFEQDIQLRAILVSHGHLDHVGGVRYVYERYLRHVSRARMPRIISSAFTRLVAERMVFEGDPCPYPFFSQGFITVGPFKIEMFPVVHSIPGSMGFVISVGGKYIVYLGDCKLRNGLPAQAWRDDAFWKRLRGFRETEVSALLPDSTNAYEEGDTPLEWDVKKEIDNVLARENNVRVVVGTFSSHLDRLTYIAQRAYADRRPLFVAGASMRRYLRIGGVTGWNAYVFDRETGTFPHVPPNAIVLATGAQGEPGSALGRLDTGELSLSIDPERDVLLMASSTIPRPEIIERVQDMTAGLQPMFRYMYVGSKAATYEEYFNMTRGLFHCSGHASRGDLKTILECISPGLVIPVHAERERREMIKSLLPAHSAICIAEESEEIVL